MTIQNYQVALKVFLKNKNDEILILENPSHFENAWYFDVPGGRIDEDEFSTWYEEILRREINEEIWSEVEYSLSMTPVSMWRFQFKQTRIFMIFFEAQYISGDIEFSEEHASYKWVKFANINLEEYFLSWMLEWVKNYLKNKTD